MGRLPPLGALVVAVSIGCDKGSDTATSVRSDQVMASGPTAMAGATTSSSSPSAGPDKSPPPPREPRAICQGDGNAKGRTMPKAAASHVEAAGAVPLDTTLGAPEWTWVNFWAAWCGPCKEEMPRLRQWSERLAREAAPVRLVFVSLDDDARQLEAFLNAQPADGVRSSLWLPEGPTRSLWLRNLRMDAAPELPEHALVDPAGRVRCFIEGAVEDGDYAAIATLVGHAPQAQPIRP